MATRGDGLGERRRYAFGGAVDAVVKTAARSLAGGRRTAMTIRCDGCVLRSIIAVSVAPHVLPGHGAYEEVLRFEVARRTRGLTP